MKNNLDCHVISLGLGGYDTFASLMTNSDEEQIIFIAEAMSPAGTSSDKQYLEQYDTINPNDCQSNPSKDPITSALVPEPPSEKSKPKEIRFGKSLRK